MVQSFFFTMIESEEECPMKSPESNERRIRFLSSNDALVEEGLSEMHNRQMLKYWGRKGRRYSEAEKAFLNRVRLPATTEDKVEKKQPAWFSYCDPGGE